MNLPRATVFSIVCGLLLTVSGCSVPIAGVMGLSVEDDRVVATVRMCEGATSDRLELRDSRIALFGLGRPTWQFDAMESGEVDLGDVEVFLAEFGDESSLSFNASSTIGVGPYLTFTTAELEAISSGGMLVNDVSSNRVIVADTTALDEQRDRLCEIYF